MKNKVTACQDCQWYRPKYYPPSSGMCGDYGPYTEHWCHRPDVLSSGEWSPSDCTFRNRHPDKCENINKDGHCDLFEADAEQAGMRQWELQEAAYKNKCRIESFGNWMAVVIFVAIFLGMMLIGLCSR